MKAGSVSVRTKLYHFLVNRHNGIRERYHQMHDGTSGIKKVLSWVYLLWLNFCYYFLFLRFLGKTRPVKFLEEKNLPLEISESEMHTKKLKRIEEYVELLSRYDVISFDIFDTLLFRPFSEPEDLFYFLSLKLGMLDFQRIRKEQEILARQDCYKQKGHYEVTFQEIWNRIERETGKSAEEGMQMEQELEQQFCYANPFMKEVFQALQKQGKEIIIISDMYLPKAFLQKLLEQNGFTCIKRLYVSCEYGVSKYDGGLYRKIKEDFENTGSIVHVGDNEYSDGRQAKNNGFNSVIYPNVNQMALSYRSYDLSPMIGGAYRGIVDNHLYQGLRSYSLEYEYGFIYGGLFVLGYCHFIYEYCRDNQITKILFLSRDGDILKQVYDKLYPEANTEYVYWSRSIATKLMAEHDRYDYIRRFLYQKVNKNISINKILSSMELDFLQEKLMNWHDNSKNSLLSGTDLLTDKNVEILKQFLLSHFDAIIDAYHEQNEAAKCYYSKILDGEKKAAAVDIGWAGSGAISLSYLVERVWKLPCEITGLIAGTNTINSPEPYASESFLQAGKLSAYLFSQADNRDVMKNHDCNIDDNIYWELLLASPTKSFIGFAFDKDTWDSGKKEIQFRFGNEEPNQKGMKEIQKGILDFVEEYENHFKAFPYMMNISGRDAYAPMLVAFSHNRRFLKVLRKRFSPVIDIG